MNKEKIMWRLGLSIPVGLLARYLIGFMIGIVGFVVEVLSWISSSFKPLYDLFESVFYFFWKYYSIPQLLISSFVAGFIFILMIEVELKNSNNSNNSTSGGERSQDNQFAAFSYYENEMNNNYKKNFSFVDASGAWRRWGEDFIDSKGFWASWDGFYDKEGNWSNGSSFVDAKGYWASLDKGFYDYAGNWIPGP